MLDPAASLKIYAYEWVPPFAQGHVRDLRPRWACEEAGIPYREHLINVMNKPTSYFGEQPWGQVPAIVDDGIHVFESGATLIHLGEKSETLLPAGGQARATTLSWLLGAFNTVEPVMMEFGNITFFAKGEEWATLRRPSLEEFLRKRLAPVEARVAGEEWIAGAFSIADIAMVTILRTIEDSPLIAEHPAIGRYLERGTARPAYARALADQMAAFARHPQPQMEGA
ncbi:glutathione S-transferase family protein [Tsuneonella sp. HG094]